MGVIWRTGGFEEGWMIFGLEPLFRGSAAYGERQHGNHHRKP